MSGLDFPYLTDTGGVIDLVLTDTGTLKRAPKPGLPELIIDDADPTAAAKELGVMFAQGDEFLFNGHAPIRHRSRGKSHASRAGSHDRDACASWLIICNPTKCAHEARSRAHPGRAQQGHRAALSERARRTLGPQAVPRHHHGADLEATMAASASPAAMTPRRAVVPATVPRYHDVPPAADRERAPRARC